MKNLYLAVAVVAAAAAFGCAKKAAPGAVDFEVIVQRTGDMVTMQSARGADWKEAAWACKGTPCKFIVDRSGVMGEPAKDQQPSGFAFSVYMTKNGVDLKAISGANWQSLQYSCTAKPCKFIVDTAGVRGSSN